MPFSCFKKYIELKLNSFLVSEWIFLCIFALDSDRKEVDQGCYK